MPVPASYFQDHPLRIGTQSQLLIDDYAVEDRWELTREFLLEGNRLRLNTIMPGLNYREIGIRVEIARRPQLGQHTADFSQAYPGFSLEECDPICGTRIENPVTWNGGPDLSHLTGKPVYLRFEIRNMGLFSFQVSQE